MIRLDHDIIMHHHDAMTREQIWIVAHVDGWRACVHGGVQHKLADYWKLVGPGERGKKAAGEMALRFQAFKLNHPNDRERASMALDHRGCSLDKPGRSDLT